MCFGIIWDVLTQLSNILSIICGIVLVPLQLLLFFSSIMKFISPIICWISKTVITASAVTLPPAWGCLLPHENKQIEAAFPNSLPTPLFPMTSNFLPWGNIWSFGQLFRRQNHHHHKHQLGKILDWLVGLSVEKIWILNSLQQQTHSQSLIVMIYRIVSTLFINSIAVDKLSWKDMPDIRYKLMPMPGSILMEQCPSEYDRNNWSSGG